MVPYWIGNFVITELLFEICHLCFNTQCNFGHDFEKFQFSTPLFFHGDVKNLQPSGTKTVEQSN